MMITEGKAPTDRAARYLKQVLSHFSHKIDVEQGEDSGSATFGAGKAYLTATEDALVVRVEAADAEGAATVQRVIVGHAERFGEKDQLKFGDFAPVAA
ncbi:DUF2218 domain-containing protein [Catellatospora sp. KI3]|uniref:DUF2218 domain-containing protein n=1 Tax=Catellatospora sp. KI3 TaxID=3041620 RepID=UPI002482E0B7|nr:DUF2218 domain-containing protein [Catellatospora sp. KI3]MDI1461950.1 DUF2218 domain-containing protein [Catellatospora sp. KI3]